jgi:iron complex outermembrane receptor protein
MGFGVKGRSHVIDILLIATLAVAGPVPAFATETHQFNVPAEAAPAAIRDFAQQAHVQILVAGENVKEKHLHAVSGELSTDQGLRILLADSGLSPQYVGDRSIALVTQQEAGSKDSRGNAPRGSDNSTSATKPAPSTLDVASSTNNVFGLEEVVVTGTAGETTKFTAPYAVSTIKEQAMLDKAPRSLVDLLRSQPGLYVENSGGEGGDENIVIRGLPYSGFRLIDVLQDGLPLFESNYERFLNIDELYRVDLMTEHAEIVRGGTAPIYSNNASGGVINLIARHGTPTPEGAVQVEVGSNSLTKVSAYQTGPITDHLLFAAGGSYRRDDGMRDQHFTPANEGGQAQFGLTWLFSGGKLFADAKYLNDRSVFYTDIPLVDPRTGASLSSLIDPHTGTLTSSSFQNVAIRTLDGTPTGAVVSRDLKDGVNPRVATFTLGGDFDLGAGWKLTDRARFVHGTIGLDGIFNASTPQDATAYLASQLAAAKAAFPGTTSLGYSLVGSNTPYDPATTAGLVMANNFDSIRNQIRDLMNDVRLVNTFDLGSWGTHDLTFGFYSSHYHYAHQEMLNAFLANVRNNPDALNIRALDAAGNVLGYVTENGFLSYGAGSNSGWLDGTALAGYLADTVHLTSRWQVDAGVRHEGRRQSGEQGVLGSQTVSTTGPLAARRVQGIVSYSPHHEDLHGTAYTFGTAYDLNSSLNGFLRYTRSYSYPQFTTIISGALLPNGQPLPVSTINQAEAGLKFQVSTFQAALTAYYAHFNQLSSTVQVAAANGSVSNSSVVLNTTTTGVEGEIDWLPVKFFELSGSFTLQDPKVDSVSTLTGVSASSTDNKTISRTPKYVVSLEPAYLFNIQGWRGRVFTDVYTVGRRYQDFSNLSVLPGYTTLDVGMTLMPDEHLELRVLGSNVTNSAGLTEGNSRASVLNTGTVGDATVGRPLFGRTIVGSAMYRW